jgi:hypothetical protein
MVARAPRKKMYRTMQGRMVDIEKLRAANEGVQAVGNMNVNARGDALGVNGQIVTKKEKIIQKYYEHPKGRVDDTPARGRPATAPAPRTPPKQTVQTMTPVAKTEVKQQPAPEPVVAPKIEAEPTPVATFKPKTESTEKKGIDAALDGLE